MQKHLVTIPNIASEMNIIIQNNTYCLYKIRTGQEHYSDFVISSIDTSKFISEMIKHYSGWHVLCAKTISFRVSELGQNVC
jgi:hypothetical protein